MNRRITKIKYKPNETIFISWTAGPANEDEYSIKCRDLPRCEFNVAMRALDQFVLEMCELPEDRLHLVNTRGVSFNYGGGNETMGATISAQMELQKTRSVLNINTPNKPVEPYSEGTPWDETTCLSVECANALETLLEEANRYIDGDRAQGSLFGEEKKPA